MPLEVRELVIKVHVGDQTAAPRPLDELELAALKRDVIDACLAEIRQQARTAAER